MTSLSPLDVLRIPTLSVDLADFFDFQQTEVRGVSLAVDEEARKRIAAAGAVAQQRTTAAIPFLIAMLHQDRISGSSEDLVAAFSSGHATTEDGRKVENMTRLAEADAVCRIAASDALASLGVSAVPELIETLSAPSPNQRSGAANALGKIGAPAETAVPKLDELAKRDPTETVRKAAAEASKQIRPRKWFSF